MSRPVGLVDIHCHLMPGLDDGPPSQEESIQLCRQLVQQGVVTAAATSHQRGGFAQISRDTILQSASDLAALLARHDIPLKIVPNAEWMLDAATVEDIESYLPHLLTVADGGRYALVEFPYLFPTYAPLVGELLIQKGLKPVLAHIEQYETLTASRDRLREILQSGYLVQVNADSIVGSRGARRQRACRKLIRRGLVHLIASDAHSVSMRPCRMADAWDKVYQWAGEDAARILLIENPLAVIEGRETATVPVTSWWGRLLRRQN